MKICGSILNELRRNGLWKDAITLLPGAGVASGVASVVVTVVVTPEAAAEVTVEVTVGIAF